MTQKLVQRLREAAVYIGKHDHHYGLMEDAADALSTYAIDATRYRWLRAEFSYGRESYIGESMLKESETDAYIDARRGVTS